MNVYSDTPGIQFYTGNYIVPINGKDNVEYRKRHAFCLETQTYPDSIGPISEEHKEFAKGRCFHLTPPVDEMYDAVNYEHNVIYSFGALNQLPCTMNKVMY